MSKRGRIILFLSALIILTAAVLFFYRGRIFKKFYSPTATGLPSGVENAPKPDVEIIAENLQIPWEIAFLPDGDPEGSRQGGTYRASLLVTERPGTLKRIGKEGRVYNIEGVEHIGEGGLLGMALHPRFAENHWIYLYLTTKVGDELKNRVERYRFEGDRLSEKIIIINNIPGAAYHDGGRIAFAPDGYFYITTGDAGNSQLAQDVNSLAGKILRLKDNGSVPSDNPFGNAVWSYGHRNPQGLAWDDKGWLRATEHGRSGVLSGFDELNLIEKGKNYGWPAIQGPETKAGMISPVAQSGTDETWAPAGAAFWSGSLFFGGLRGESLYEAKILDSNKISLKVHFRQEFGRIRAVVLGPDDYIYISTSNTDGRGEVRLGDDKIIRINPEVFRKD